MTESPNAEIVEIKKPEASDYIVYQQSTTSNFVNYINNNSLIPSSLDQILKNNIIIWAVADEQPLAGR
jgi:hypothetical protein